jgi:hypothetical protein
VGTPDRRYGAAKNATRATQMAPHQATASHASASAWSDNAWLAANAVVFLGTLALAQGRPEDARALLDEGLALSLAAHSTHSVALCLPSCWPGSARRWGRTGSARCSPPGPGSASRRRWPPSATGTAPGPPEPGHAACHL